MRRLTILTTGLGRGGAETQLTRLAITLRAKYGWAVSVVCMVGLGHFGQELRQAGISVQSLEMTRGRPTLSSAVAAILILRRLRPDVLCAFMYHAIVLARLAGRVASVPVIVSSIRNEDSGGGLRDSIIRWTDRLGDMTTANSQVVAKALVRNGIVPSEHRIRVIRNGIDVDQYVRRDIDQIQRLRAELGASPKDFVWLVVGSLSEQKDIPNLLRAVARLAPPHPVLAVAGSGPLAEELQQMAAGRLGGRIHWLGLRSDVPELLAAADALVLSSAWEGLPNVVMEALASGTPVVATEVGGVRELVTPGVSGFLAPPRDPLALAEAMTQMMSATPAQRREMGEVGKAHVRAHFGVDRIVDEWKGLFDALIATKHYEK